MYLDNERRPTLTPQLAVRVAIIGGVALVGVRGHLLPALVPAGAVGDKYVAEAQGNQLREIRVQAPRGDIVDREGRVLVDEPASAWRSRSRPTSCPRTAAERRVLYRRLGRLLGMRPRAIERRVNEQFKELPFSRRRSSRTCSRDVVMYIEEREEDFHGVEVEPVFLREYPHNEIGAHLFGYVGEVSQDELKEPRYSGVRERRPRRQGGLEAEYDRFLRGTSGATRVQVDALGNLSRKLDAEQPKQGSQLRLSLDLDVQRAGQEALAGGTGKGAFAVMDIHNGEVLGARLAALVRPEPVREGVTAVRLRAR